MWRRQTPSVVQSGDRYRDTLESEEEERRKKKEEELVFALNAVQTHFALNVETNPSVQCRVETDIRTHKKKKGEEEELSRKKRRRRRRRKKMKEDERR